MSFAAFAFKPWRRLRPEIDESAIQAYLHGVARNAHGKFRMGMEASRGGRTYTMSFRTINGVVRPVKPRAVPHTASAPGAYPAVETGRLKGSIRTVVRAREATIGTSMHYSKYLRHGTRKMAKRKMSPAALQEGIAETRKKPFVFARWRLG